MISKKNDLTPWWKLGSADWCDLPPETDYYKLVAALRSKTYDERERSVMELKGG